MTPPAFSSQGKNSSPVSTDFILYTHTHTHAHTHLILFLIHTQAATVIHEHHQKALCAIKGLEDSGNLEHDGAGLWVVHPLGAVEWILQHVFKCCR